jgi:chromate transporter
VEQPLVRIPAESLGRLFWRYLRFGLLAWGGPVAQIAMIRQELVDEKRWVSPEHFNRVLAVYQVLPGPEAHEMCVYFGMLSRARLGGFLAGLGFMLPGFVLMFALSALYASGIESRMFKVFFWGVQPAVVALIVRAIHRIGQRALKDRWLWALAIAAGLAQAVGTSFWITLPVAGAVYLFVTRREYALAAGAAVLLVAGVLVSADLSTMARGFRWSSSTGESQQTVRAPDGDASVDQHEPVSVQRTSLDRLFVSGLRSGLLTFGGAYTVLPFLRNDAVEVGRWMTDREFLDGVALSGILPAPFIIFSTFVGYLGGGPLGALVLTVGIFLPAFGFTLIGHNYMERLIAHRGAHAFLDGVTAGVVGLIAATSLALFQQAVRGPVAGIIFTLALIALYRWKAKTAVAATILAAGGVGLLFLR